MKNFISKIFTFPAQILAAIISVYQVMLSPDHSWLAARFPNGYCRHYPSCSEYSRQSLLKFGLLKGLYLSARRITTCHPWAEPSVDLVP